MHCPTLLQRSGVVVTAAVGLALVAPAAAAQAEPAPRPAPQVATTTTTTSTTTSTATSTTATPSYVLSAVWLRTDRGLRMQVKPTMYGRTHAQHAPRTAWEQARNKAGHARLSTSTYEGLYHQFRCHAKIAQQKSYWNLESWRRNVGYTATLRAFCNP